MTLDDEVMGRVHEFAEPWVDSPNSALRRVFQMEEGPASAIYFEIERVEEDDGPVATNRAAPTATVGGGAATARAGDTRP